MASRAQTAHYLAGEIASGDDSRRKAAVNQVASWLKTSAKAKEIQFLVSDVAQQLADSKRYYFVKITTARALSEKSRQEVTASLKNKLNASEIEAEFLVDESLIGGIKIELPGGILDNSVKRSLAKLVESIG